MHGDSMTEPSSRLASFLKEQKIDPRRLLTASYKIERLTMEDRAIKWNKKQKPASDAEKETRKPHSGRPVTPRAMQAALCGGVLSGPTKSRILRAVNAILSQKKKDAVDLRALF